MSQPCRSSRPRSPAICSGPACYSARINSFGCCSRAPEATAQAGSPRKAAQRSRSRRPWRPASGLPRRGLARHSSCGELVEIFLPIARLIAAQLVEIVPAVDPGRMHVVEGEPHGIIADRLHLENFHISLARNGFSLVRRMALDLGARALHAQVFGRQYKVLAGIEADRESLAGL